MINLAVIGSKGQLAESFRFATNQQLTFFPSSKIDITQPDTFSLLEGYDCIINCAAYTAVDQAEEFPEKAYAINRMGVIHLVHFCEAQNIGLIHFSTDFVFNGESLVPYSEEDYTNPLSVYGASKLAGEEIILQSSLSALIIRTSWLYSPFGSNFCKTMIRLSADRSEISVVNDQIGTPTSAIDLARVVLELLAKGMPSKPELLHISNSGQCSWAEFAREIFSTKGISVRVNPISSNEFEAAALRPKYSVLSTEKLLLKYGLAMRPWQEALEETLKLL